ncbi:hypothetical protein BDF20DRAFT_873723 [Mycotypha africana]|uniref:uncharacterized protein n=1 Tax=Mycotypha africana TaxID=64632 RepID=UPI0023000CB2|nr:uncharacterized protein BDF20DRAFT_873723 [Mycotypha africana]KAI8977243.1 hypothetical protein BDF20DRAFT_873723 [Mycotypha africana]
MADNVCHSILRTATQQIIQSAGFEGANNQSIDTLTEVFEKYIELLGSTVTAYANLNDRTTGTARDVSETLEELNIDAKGLREWTEKDGKALSPSWSAQSDPGRLLQGVINGGKPTFEDILEYQFGDVSEFELLSPTLCPDADLSTATATTDDIEEDTEESPATPSNSARKHLPDYVPAYFPSFPAEMKDEDADEAAANMLKQQQLEAEKQKQLQQKQQQLQSSALPLPNVVKKRKKPIDNPFTHLIPYEDSSLALESTEVDTVKSTALSNEQSGAQQPSPVSHLSQAQQQKPLFLLLKQSTKRNDTADAEEENSTDVMHHNSKRRKSKHSTTTRSLAHALQHLTKSDYQLGEGLMVTEEGRRVCSEQYNQLLQKQVENSAAPGNHMFYHEDRMLDDIVQCIAPPIAVSKLMAPNLLTDVAIVSSGSSSNNNLSSMPGTPTTSTQTSGMLVSSRAGSPETAHHKPSKYQSNSMLAALAKGASVKKNYNKKFGKTGLAISKHSVDINAKKVGESKYLMKKRKMLAEKQAALERQRLLEERLKENPNADVATLTAEIEREQQLQQLQRQRQQQQQQQQQQEDHPLHKIPTSPPNNITVDHSYSYNPGPQRKLSFSVEQERRGSNESSSSVGSSPLPQAPNEAAASTAKTGPISLSSYLANSTTPSTSSTVVVEKKKKQKKTPSLTLNLSQNKHRLSNGDNSAAASPTGNTPRIRFKLKPPEQQTPTLESPDNAKPISNGGAMKPTTTAPSDSTKPVSAGQLNTSRPYSTSFSSPSSLVNADTVSEPVPTTTVMNKNHHTTSSPTPTASIKMNKHNNHPMHFTIPNTTTTSSSSPSFNDYSAYPSTAATATGNEEINCICENPSVDYGTFMIACDQCSTWFHGSCIGIAETDPIEEWYCKRCRRGGRP